jgi:uncharacterized membrane protein HdeD (DUF308 family)
MSAVAIPHADSTAPWWLILLQGIALLIVGLLLLSAPGESLIFLVQILAAYWLVSGCFGLVAFFQDSRQGVWKLVFGVLGIVAGLVVLRHPLWSTYLVTGATVFFVIAAAFIMGFMQIVGGWRERAFGMAALGIVSILLGLVLVVNPMLGATALPFALGILATVGGVISIVLAIRSH